MSSKDLLERLLNHCLLLWEVLLVLLWVFLAKLLDFLLNIHELWLLLLQGLLGYSWCKKRKSSYDTGLSWLFRFAVFKLLLEKIFNCVFCLFVHTLLFQHFFEVARIKFPTYKILLPLYTSIEKTDFFSPPTCKSSLACSVEWIKDILLIIDVTFLTSFFSSLSLLDSFTDSTCWIFFLEIAMSLMVWTHESSEYSESISTNFRGFDNLLTIFWQSWRILIFHHRCLSPVNLC